MRDLYNTKAQEYEKALFEMTAAIGASMETVPNADKTVIGKIITVYDKKPGTYRVQVENVTFDAITQYNYEYSKDDTVYVTILKGDYSGEKRIVGKVEDLTSELENFYKTNPLKDLVIRAEDSSSCSVDLGATKADQSFSTAYPTNKNRQIGIEFELQAKPLGAIKIDYNKMAGLLFTLKSGTTAIKPFFINLSELTGNLAYAMEGLPFKVVRDIDTHFDDKGNILSFDKYDVTFINHGAITDGTLTAYIKKFYFGMSADDIAKNTLKVKIGVPAKDANGQETEDIEWSTGSVVQEEVGNIANIGGSQKIHLSLSWQYFDEVKKQIVTFDTAAFDDEQDPFANYPQLAANTTITWQKRTQRQDEWIDLGEPQRSIKTADAYVIEDTYHIAVKPKSGEEGAGYDYDDNYQDYGKLPGQYIEYRAILSFGGIESNTVKFENKFNPTNYIPPVEVVGENLLLKSGALVTNSNYCIASYNLMTIPIVGETYTISLKGKLGEGKRCFSAYNSGGMVILGYLHKVEGSEDLYAKTFTWTNTWKSDTQEVTVIPEYINIYVMEQTINVASTIEWIKLEKGNKATKWTPALVDPIAYTDTEVGKFDTKVAQLLGLGETIIGDKYVISPYIGGGYLDITKVDPNGNNIFPRVIIDPNDWTKQNKIFQVYNSQGTMVIGLDANGNAIFEGSGKFSGQINVADKFKVDEHGNVTLTGNITWGIDASPTQVVYARTALTKPANNTKYDSFNNNSSTTWHKIFDGANDKYASYTYDGGATWGNVIQIVGSQGAPGEKGEPGAPGTSVKITSIQYAIHSSGTSAPVSGWQSTPPGVNATNPYLWTKVTYSDGNVSYSSSKNTITRDELWSFLGDEDGIYQDNGKIAIRASSILSGALQIGGTAGYPNSSGVLFYADVTNPTVKIGGFTVDASSISNGKASYSDSNDGVYIGTSGIGLGKGKFYVTNTGALTCTSGSIAAFTISGNSLRYGKDSPSDSKDGVYLGKTGIGLGKGKFYVTAEGILTCTNANISGILTAGNNSQIGEWKVENNNLGYTGERAGETVYVLHPDAPSLQWSDQYKITFKLRNFILTPTKIQFDFVAHNEGLIDNVDGKLTSPYYTLNEFKNKYNIDLPSEGNSITLTSVEIYWTDLIGLKQTYQIE